MPIDLKAIDKKKVAVVVLAIVMALLAVMLTHRYIKETSAKEAKILAGGMTGEETKKILSRVEGIEKMNQELITRQNSLAQQAQAIAQEQAASKINPPKSQQSLAGKTPAGKRAITVIIDKVYAVGGMISPGDYVDVLAHLYTPSNIKGSDKTNTITLTLFQNTLVLAVGINLQSGLGYDAQQSASSLPVTLALNPQEAGLISFAQQHGVLQLVLRPPTETQSYILQPATWGSLSEYIMNTQGTDMGFRKSDIIEKPKARIEIYRGGKVSDQ